MLTHILVGGANIWAITQEKYGEGPLLVSCWRKVFAALPIKQLFPLLPIFRYAVGDALSSLKMQAHDPMNGLLSLATRHVIDGFTMPLSVHSYNTMIKSTPILLKDGASKPTYETSFDPSDGRD
jgi:hypothetical protein